MNNIICVGALLIMHIAYIKFNLISYFLRILSFLMPKLMVCVTVFISLWSCQTAQNIITPRWVRLLAGYVDHARLFAQYGYRNNLYNGQNVFNLS